MDTPAPGIEGNGGRGAAAHELARYEALFAHRTQGMRSSAMRDMMALTGRTDVISLAGGLPDTTTFPPGLFSELMDGVAQESARALQYGPTEGMQAAVACIEEVMAAEGTAVDGEEILVTTGGQQVIDLVCKALIDPGDVIVAEAPTYPGAVPTFSAYEARVVQIEIDGDGMPVERLRSTLDELAAEGCRPKFIYTIPNFQNPGGETLPLERRAALVELARERELLVLEDNPYGLLRYSGDALPTLYSLDAKYGSPGMVVYLGTFSKILAPGLRLGWAVAPAPVLAKLNLGKQGADLCSPSVTQLFVARYFAQRAADGTPLWQRYLSELRGLYRARRDAMHEALGEHFGADARWTRPDGGLFLWLTLDERIDTTDLLALAREKRGVAFVPGRAAYADERRGASSMRLNFAGLPEPQIREGVRRIGDAVAEQLGLLESLSGRRGGGRQAPGPARRPLAEVLRLPRRRPDDSAGRRSGER
ncbi:MAG TPA: PLP-dependent aminotransferase family protein [Solirubrobacteraceae bacterium]|nr:PLP-dependent aminotransferase family protein [Solirubrobacteraceae bacterium]